MKTPADILKIALKAPDRDELTQHLGTVYALRDKNYSWREIADFLREHGVETEHTKLFRLYTKHRSQTMNVPDAKTYETALRTIKLTQAQSQMLAFHYGAHNRTVTYTELAASIGSSDYRSANMAYGKLGRTLGEAIGYTFPIASARGEPFYSGALGFEAPRTEKSEFRLMMHHELAKAIGSLNLFNH